MATSLEIVVHLVHGTWPRGLFGRLPSWVPRTVRSTERTWYEEGSDFRNALRQLIGQRVTFEVFEWSGANSLLARKEAAEGLRRHLNLARTGRPDAQHFVIAHSHGGNVAADALRDGPVCRLITLGTPFLQIEPNNPRRSEVWVLDRALIGAIRLPLVLILLALLWRAHETGGASDWVQLLYYIVVLGLILTIFGQAFMDQTRGRLGLTSFVRRKPHEDVFSALTRHSPPANPLRVEAPRVSPPLPILVVTAEGDEAAKVLAMARAAAQRWTILWKVVQPLARLAEPVVALINAMPQTLREVIGIAWFGSAILAMFAFGTAGDRYQPYLLTVLALIMWESFLGLLAAPLLIGTSGFYAFGFGWEMAYVAHLLDIRASPTPLARPYVLAKIQDLETRAGHLRHSLHAFPEARARVASWIKSCSSRGPGCGDAREEFSVKE